VRRLLPFLGTTLVVLVACTGAENRPDARTGESTRTSAASASGEACAEVVCLTEAALDTARGEGIEVALRYVENATMGLASGQDICHDVLHRVGVREADRGQLRLSTPTLTACSGGFFHGLFAGYGLRASWAADMVAACAPFTGLDSLLCKHGYGHGAVAGSSSAGDAMMRCKEVVTRDGVETVEGVRLLELCSDGGFMEVVVKINTGEWVREAPSVMCSGLEDWAAWGCWRQMGRVLDITALTDFAEGCNKFETYLAEACAVGVAEVVVANRLAPEPFCGVLRIGADLCTTRARARLG